MTTILILYYSRGGHCRQLAEHILWGVETITDCQAICRTVPDLTDKTEMPKEPIPNEGHLYAKLDDLIQCDGLVLGSPTYFGNMASPLKYFLEQTSGLWFKGALAGKPASLFTSSSSLHGGQESTLLSMMIPLLHHGMLISGLPYTNSDLVKTKTGGSPYGATHFEAGQSSTLSDEEKRLCESLGKRLATIAKKLKD